jgi:hypothetical protein
VMVVDICTHLVIFVNIKDEFLVLFACRSRITISFNSAVSPQIYTLVQVKYCMNLDKINV